MIKKLFLIDGLAGTGKNDLIDFIEQKHHSTSTVVYKYTTRTHRGRILKVDVMKNFIIIRMLMGGMALAKRM